MQKLVFIQNSDIKNIAIELPMEEIAKFCDRWQIVEFALFGSILRNDFRPDSDIDILVTFAPTAQRGLTETLQMVDELETMFDRSVDLIVKSALDRSKNWLRRKNILESAKTIYAKGSNISNRY